jgi:hypothetical protein
MNKPRKYKNPLAQEIAHASSAMNDLLDDSVVIYVGAISTYSMLPRTHNLGASGEKKHQVY